MLTSFAGQAFLAVSGIAVARMLGVEDRGTSHYLILIPSILTQVGSLGLPTAATNYLANADYNSHEILRAIRGPAVALAVSLVPLQLLLISLLFQGDAPSLKESPLPPRRGSSACYLGLPSCRVCGNSDSSILFGSRQSVSMPGQCSSCS